MAALLGMFKQKGEVLRRRIRPSVRAIATVVKENDGTVEKARRRMWSTGRQSATAAADKKVNTISSKKHGMARQH